MNRLAVFACLLFAPTPGRTLDVGPGRQYADLAGALADARDGDTVVVHGGVYPGPVVIDRAVALVGENDAVIDGRGTGTVVAMQSDHARLTGFVIRNSGSRLDKEDAGIGVYATATVTHNVLQDVLFGIDVQRAPESVITDNTIVGRDLPMPRRGDAVRLWESAGSTLAHNSVDRARDIVVWYSADTTVTGNTVTNSRYGLHFMYASGSNVEGNRLYRNAVGAYAMYSSDLSYVGNEFTGNHGPSGYGLALKESSRIEIRDNVFAGNRTGIYFDNSPLEPDAFNHVRNNVIANNDIGLAFVPSVKRNVFTSNRFEDNFEQVAVVAGGAFEGNIWTEDGVGNFWSNYAGFDADGDGIGDVPHSEASLFHSLLVTEPVLRLFSLSPAQTALDLAARAFPVFRPPASLVDTAPLTRAPLAALQAGAQDTRALGLLSAACIAAGLAVAAWGRSPAVDRPTPA